jgi:endonuclease YncB( thermonuclease family)
MTKEAWEYPGSRLDAVVDGDSFFAVGSRSFDAGFHITVTTGWRQKFRLNRINAAPAKTAGGRAATEATTRLLAGTFHLSSVGPYKYGDEWMAEVTTAAGINVSDELVRLGVAVYWDGTGPRPLGETE